MRNENTTMTFDQRLQRYLRGSAARGREVVRAGPFTAFFDRGDPMRYLNYAIPEEGAAPTAEEATALTRPFAERERLPRLEYVESEAPELATSLEAAGYAREATLDLMTCTPATLRRPALPAGAALEQVTDPERVRVLRRTQRVAFGQPADGATSGLGESVGLLVTVGGEPAAGGLFTAPQDGLTELAGIGTLPAFRRRGIAAALTAALAAEAFARGVEIAFLTPGDDDTRRVYERAGLEATTTILAYALER
jgi:ribosomal protein S18 acetylase RimI-like enzyme